MPEKLTQAQIDALLNRMSSGEQIEDNEDQKRIKEYDFRSPKKFTKEQLKTLDSLHENFSRQLSSYLSGILRVFCEVSVLQIEEQSYFEYNNALPDTALIGLLNFAPANKRYSDGTFIMDVATNIGYFMIDRLLGGQGTGYNLSRNFTDIEIAILDKVMNRIVGFLADAWRNYLDVDIGLNSLETNARLLQALAPEDIVVIVVLNVKIRDMQGTMSVCIPAENLEEVVGQFSLKYARSTKKQSLENEEAKRQIIFDTLTDSNLEVKAVLAEMQLDLRDIMQLQPEDVIPLHKSIKSDISILVDNTPWFYAKLGETKTRKAVKLNNQIQ